MAQNFIVLHAKNEMQIKNSICQRTNYQLFTADFWRKSRVLLRFFACGLIVADGDLLVVDSGLLVVDGDLLVLCC